MIYDFSGVDKVHLYMDDRNENMICDFYNGGDLLRKETLVRDCRPIEVYRFMENIKNSGVNLVVGNSNEKKSELEECLIEDLTSSHHDSYFCQY